VEARLPAAQGGRHNRKGSAMGQKAQESIDIVAEDLPMYLRANHAVFMDLGEASYYLTDVNDHFWRVQDAAQLNDKGHFVDVSEPVDSVEEFLSVPSIDGKSILEVLPAATLYASEKPEA
jgi:hypothetical protein